MKTISSSPPPKSIGLVFRSAAAHHKLVKLFSVTVTHSFYTLDQGLCPDFEAAPTPSTASFMAAFGIALRNDAAGFSVFIQQVRLPQLVEHLRQGVPAARTGEPGTGLWSRLTFTLRLTNPLFVGITALPIETKTTQLNLYACNTQAHQAGSAALLSPGAFMDASALHPVVGSEVSLAVPARAATVSVTDISGALVIPPQPVTPAASGDSAPAPRKHTTIDLGGLPHDLYTIAIADAQGQPLDEGGYPRDVLYVDPAQPQSMVLLDLLFTCPTPQSQGVYPIPSLFDPPASGEDAPPSSVAYQLPFDARHTYWQYFVVSQDPASKLIDLKIQGSGAHFRKEAGTVELPNGARAVLFKAQSTLPLRQKSPQQFQLSGQRRDANGHKNEILISRLPVAGSAPVWPQGDGQSESGVSEIFVYV